jgi:regulator of sirC expression with transglutaminase-like and TPR domain
VENLVHDIQIDEVHRRLRVWVKGGGEDLLEGAFIICRYRYPDLDEDKMKAQLRALRQDIWLELGDNLTAFEKVRVINHVIYHVHGFKGNKKNYHAPQNCYLNEVLDGRKGNPLSLAMVYQIVSEELNLPVLGVNLPNHFVLAYMEDENTNKKKNTEHDVLFYINPFSQGDILGRKEVDEFLQKLNLPKDPTFYRPCTNIDTIRRQHPRPEPSPPPPKS